MRPQIIGSVAVLGSVSLAAANDIVSLILPNVDKQALVGKVIGNDGPMTTYVINCPDSTDSDDCGVPDDGMTVIAGPTAFIYEYTFEDYWLRESCVHSSTTWFSCEVTNTQSDVSTSTTIAESVELPLMPVTITATATDADVKSTATTASATATDTASESSSESSPTKDSETASTTTQSSESASTTTDSKAAAEESASDNAAIAQATGSATQWLVSGAGMALALALA
ncbi:hypothetical protein BJX76DRAFT_356812 [Aspergillus varians]